MTGSCVSIAIWRSAAALITVMADQPIRQPLDFLRHVVLVRDVGLFELWLVVGAALAAPMFASTVVAIPLLLDREVDFVTAMLTSLAVVTESPLVMLGWGVVIGASLFVAMLPGFAGLFVVLPVFGHATWHLYRRAIAWERKGP